MDLGRRSGQPDGLAQEGRLLRGCFRPDGPRRRGVRPARRRSICPGSRRPIRDRPNASHPARAAGAAANRRCGGSTAPGSWRVRSDWSSPAIVQQRSTKRSRLETIPGAISRESLRRARARVRDRRQAGLQSRGASPCAAARAARAAASQMRDQQRERRRRHAFDLAGMSDGARPMRRRACGGLRWRDRRSPHNPDRRADRSASSRR